MGEIIKESNSENGNNQEIVSVEIDSDNSEGDEIKTLPNSSIFSDLMAKSLGSIMSSSNSLKITPPLSGESILGVPIYTLGAHKLRIRDNDYELTPEIYKALSYTVYTGQIMKNENDILMMNNIIKVLAYTGVEDRDSKRKTFFTKTLPKLFDEIQNRTFDEFDLEGQGVKLIIPSNINDIYTRLEILLGLNLSGHTDTLTEASNLIAELYKRGEIQNKQQYRNAPNNFSNQQMELSSKLLEQIASNTRPKIEEHMLLVMDKSTHEEHLSQPLQTNNKQFKIAITFLTGYNAIFNVTNSINNFYVMKSVTDEDAFIQITISPGAYEIESLNNEINRIIIDEEHYTEGNYPFTIKARFSAKYHRNFTLRTYNWFYV